MNRTIDKILFFIVMDVLGRANELQQKGVGVVYLEIGEPGFDVPDCMSKAVKAVYKNGFTHYTYFFW